MAKIDGIDRKILEILRENASITNQKLGKKIGLSEPAARRRVAKLVSGGVIRRFTIDIEKSGEVSSLVLAATSLNSPSSKILRQLQKRQDIGVVWELSGDTDVALTLYAKDINELNRKIDEIRNMPGIKKTQLSVVLKKWK